EQACRIRRLRGQAGRVRWHDHEGDHARLAASLGGGLSNLGGFSLTAPHGDREGIMTTTATAPAPAAAASILEELTRLHGESERARATAGIARVAERWTRDDGDAAALRAFCVDHYVPLAERSGLVDRLEAGVSWVGGHLYELRRHLRRFTDLRGT